MINLASEESNSPLLPVWPEVFVGLFCFAVIFFVFYKKLLPNINRTLEERREAIEGGMEKAEATQAEARQTLESYKEQLAEARHEAARLRQEAQERFVGGIRNLCVPSGLPKGIYVILTPIEFFSNIFLRPFTLAVRLFANMFAGHLLLLLFTTATWYMLGSFVGTIYSVTSLTFALLLTLFELFIQGLQAYVFAVLTATYLSQALEEAH